MLRICPTCDKAYDDFDHTTVCPHQRFGLSPDARAMQADGQLQPDTGPEGDAHPPTDPERLAHRLRMGLTGD